MNNDRDYIDADFIDIEDSFFFNAVQVSEMLGESVSTVRSWTKDDVFGDLLDIKKVNGRRVFTKQDVENLKYIQELRKRNYSISQTREYISKQGFKFGEYDGGLVNTKDPLGFEALAIKLTQKQGERLDTFKKEFMEEIGKYMYALVEDQNKHMQNIADEIAISIDSKLETFESNRNNIVDDVKEEFKGVNERLTEFNDISVSELKRVSEELEKAGSDISELKKIAYVSAEEINKVKDKGFFSWFKKK